MPTTTTTAITSGFRDGIATLQDWLTRHPNIPIAYAEYVDDLRAELTSFDVPGFEALIAIADAADALIDPSIEVTDYDDTAGVACLSVSGSDDDFAITVSTVVTNGARRVFLQSLAARPLDEAVIWTTTSAHLRAVAAAGGA